MTTCSREAVHAARGMYGARRRAGGQSALPQGADEVGEVALAQVEDRAAPRPGEGREAREVVAVGDEGVLGQAPLHP